MKLHIPVLLNEVIEGLNLKENYNVIDATLGGGGHSQRILEKTSPNGKLIGIDLDSDAIELAKKRLEKFDDRTVFVQDNYQNIKQILKNKKYELSNYPIRAILLDLGLSLYQLQSENRGFSFLDEQGLEMKYDKNDEGPDAKYIINNYKEDQLEKIFREFGEERLSKQIAREIINNRKTKEIISGVELSNIISRVYKRFYKKYSNTNPATKVFQALRIYINHEFDNIKKFLPDAIDLLESGGRLVVISYHSLEDKIIKEFFRQESRDCICPLEVPECRCNHKASLKIINKKVIIPSEDEIKINPASRSAKLRVIEKV
ncbi:MAG: 16S rRNA (cytosine(1402)-N(4))-methyltransferase RsmH [Patescibacteria group bacterium]|nr:16S rRNA (cytosine(1402)-N(4))-methyltransferase RsmH [Patescibacteria group bacterium]MDD4304673.1 16S rRNA (cytosine(1402)-N(4))-methyltransferase RsmH [Patescibacteria group bacterium]MDD4695359.1 16S rRNA (cytosine(1402)-N(4))-methyltransferase RsmH [Patescibacteria group bacterium]